MMALPCSLLLKPPFLVDILKNICGISSKNIYPILTIIAVILYLVIIKFMYIPLDKDKNEEIKD